jgi:AcrR family transcriptional regulator
MKRTSTRSSSSRSGGETTPREAILEAARVLVLKDGHERLGLRAIARKAGYSPASLYEHFEGKDAIVRALAAEANGALDRALLKGAAGEREAVARLVAIGAAYVEFARTNREDFLLLFSRLPSKRKARTEPVPVGSAYRIVAEAAEDVLGAARSGERDELAYAIWAASHGMAMLQSTHLSGFRADFPATDRVALEALVRGWLAR